MGESIEFLTVDLLALTSQARQCFQSFRGKIRHIQNLIGRRFFRWNQLNDHGTSHLSIVDGERNAVSLTSTVNDVFGSLIVSSSTGILLNNEMDDFAIPTDNSPDKLPPAKENFIRPYKRPLSSMAPTIVLKVAHLRSFSGHVT